MLLEKDQIEIFEFFLPCMRYCRAQKKFALEIASRVVSTKRAIQ